MKRFTKYLFTFLLCLTACSFVACGKKDKEEVDNYTPIHIVSMDYSDDDAIKTGSRSLYLSDPDNNSYEFKFTMQPEEASWKDLDITISNKNVLELKGKTIVAKGVGSATVVFKAKKGEFEDGVAIKSVDFTVTNPDFYTNGSYYDKSELNSKLSSGYSVKLLKDITPDEGTFTINNGFVLDLNNHKINLPGTMTFEVEGKSITIKNGKISSSKSVIFNKSNLSLKNVELLTTGSEACIVNEGKLILESGKVTSNGGVAIKINSNSRSYIGCNSNEVATESLTLQGAPAIKVLQGSVYLGNPTINNGNQNNQVEILTNSVTGDLNFKVITLTSIKVKVVAETENFKEQKVNIVKNGNAIFDYGTINLQFDGQQDGVVNLTLKSNSSVVIRPICPINFAGSMAFEFNNNDRFQFQTLNSGLITPSDNTGSYDSIIELTDSNGIIMTWSHDGSQDVPSTFTIIASYIENGRDTQQVTVIVTIDTSGN